MQEARFKVNDTFCVHIQTTDTGVDYSIYWDKTGILMDGGELTLSTPGIGVAVLIEVLNVHSIPLDAVEVQPLEMLDQLV